MAGPWEKYATPTTSDGPWAKYGQAAASPMDIPGGPDAAMGNRNAGVKPPAPSFGDKLSGVVDATKTLGSSALGGAAGMVGAGSSLLRGEGLKGAEANFGKIADAYTSKPTTEVGQKIVGRIGQGLEDSKLAGMVGLGGEAAMLSKSLPKGAAGAFGSEAGALAKKIPMNVKAEPEVLALAKKAQEYGIPLRPDMLSNNKIMRMMGEASEKVPLSGSKAPQRQEAFNRALIAQIGGDAKATRLTPDVFDKALQSSGGTIGAVYRNTPIKGDALGKDLQTIASEAAKFETSDNAKIVSSYIAEINSKMVDGVADGTAFRKIDSAIGRRVRSTPDGDLRNALGDVQEAMRDALNASISDPKQKAALQSARQQYAKAITLEPLVAKSPTGDMSAAGLMGRVTSDRAGKSRMARGQGGQMGELARIGQQFIKEPGSSGTQERGLAYGLLGGSAWANPYAAAGVYGAANLYNRLGPMLIPKKGQ